MSRISIIGAGSAAFSMSLIVDLCATRSLWGSRVTLMDIDPGRLGLIHRLAERYRREAGAELVIEATTDRSRALEGAEFVICAVKVGGYEPLEAERRIAEEHGYYRGIGDRVSCYYGGVGAYHQLAFYLELAGDMERFCPDAWLLETANPVLEGCTLLTRRTRVRTVGICHGHLYIRRLAEALGLEAGEVTAQAVGFNHVIWLTHFHHRGRDAYPLLDEWIERRAGGYWRSREYLEAEHPWQIEQLTPGAVDAYRLYGLFPIGDAVRCATPWWHHVSLEEKRRWYGRDGGFDSEIGWTGYLRFCAGRIAEIERLAAREDEPLLARWPLQPTGEQHIPLVDSLANGTERLLQLNVPNRGAIAGLPDHVVVEVPALAGARGIQPVAVGALPSRLMHNVMLPRLARMENVLEAFVKGDRLPLVLDLAADPRTRSYPQARRLIDTLLAQPWNREAAAHYRDREAAAGGGR